MSGTHLHILRHRRQSALLRLAQEAPATGEDDTWEVVGGIPTHSSLHLRTWLSECLVDEGRGILDYEPWVFNTTTERLYELSDELSGRMSTPESRKQLAVTFAQRAEQLKGQQTAPSLRLLGLLGFASYLEYPGAGIELVTLLLNHTPESSDSQTFCERVLLQEVPPSEERALLLAELYALREDRPEVLRSLWAYLDLVPEEGASPEQIEQMASVLASCTQQEDLGQLFAHPRIRPYRAALRNAADADTLAPYLAHPLELWARQHPVVLGVMGTVLATVLVLPRQAVPVLGAFALVVGLGFFIRGLKPKRKK